jgi:polyketide biosynthesis enoyl-CoA hydratase PksI
LDEVEERQSKVVVLTGLDRYFCTGGTVEAMSAIQQGQAQFIDIPLYDCLRRCLVPVINAVQGHALGGGFAFALSADQVILSRESAYTANFMQYGFTPGFGATFYLPKHLGAVLAHEMLYTGDRYTGGELEKRHVSVPIYKHSEVLLAALKFAQQLAEKPRSFLVGLKKAVIARDEERFRRVIHEELRMHDITFHQPEVLGKISEQFGAL